MTKKPEEKTLGQIKDDISTAKNGKKAVLETYNEIEPPKKIFDFREVLALIIVSILFAFALIERSKILATISGIALIIVIIKIAYGQWMK